MDELIVYYSNDTLFLLSWSGWTPWKTCSRVCELGKQLRFRTFQNCDETAIIEMRDCEHLACNAFATGWIFRVRNDKVGVQTLAILSL